jgi:hypothetical protein
MKSETPLNLSRAEIAVLRELATGRPKKVIGALATNSTRHGLARLVMAGYVSASTLIRPRRFLKSLMQAAPLSQH